MSEQAPAQAMVLAAGLGTRLWPLTADRAKPAVPFLGRPLVTHVVEHLRTHGIRRIVVNTHYSPTSVEDALTQAEDVDIRISHEPEILGTAGCLAAARNRGLLENDRTTVIVNGKLFTDIDLRRLLQTHRARGDAVSMALLENRERAAFREVLIEEDRVVGFGAGREPEGERPLLFTGIHFLEPEVLETIPERFVDTVRDVYPPLIEARRVGAIITSGRWWEFSTVARYVALHRQAHDEGWAPSVVRASTAVIHDGADVESAILWEGARVQAGALVRRSVLTADVEIRRGETIEDAIVVRRDRLDRLDGARIAGDLAIFPIAPST